MSTSTIAIVVILIVLVNVMAHVLVWFILIPRLHRRSRAADARLVADI